MGKARNVEGKIGVLAAAAKAARFLDRLDHDLGSRKQRSAMLLQRWSAYILLSITIFSSSSAEFCLRGVQQDLVLGKLDFGSPFHDLRAFLSACLHNP